MNCQKCLRKTWDLTWLGNTKVCKVCKHNARPATHRMRDIEGMPATLENLKKYLEKRY